MTSLTLIIKAVGQTLTSGVGYTSSNVGTDDKKRTKLLEKNRIAGLYTYIFY